MRVISHVVPLSQARLDGRAPRIARRDWTWLTAPGLADVLCAGTVACGASGWAVRAPRAGCLHIGPGGLQALCRLAFEPMPSGRSPLLGDLGQAPAKQIFLLKLFSHTG